MLVDLGNYGNLFSLVYYYWALNPHRIRNLHQYVIDGYNLDKCLNKFCVMDGAKCCLPCLENPHKSSEGWQCFAPLPSFPVNCWARQMTRLSNLKFLFVARAYETHRPCMLCREQTFKIKSGGLHQLAWDRGQPPWSVRSFVRPPAVALLPTRHMLQVSSSRRPRENILGLATLNEPVCTLANILGLATLNEPVSTLAKQGVDAREKLLIHF